MMVNGRGNHGGPLFCKAFEAILRVEMLALSPRRLEDTFFVWQPVRSVHSSNHPSVDEGQP